MDAVEKLRRRTGGWGRGAGLVAAAALALVAGAALARQSAPAAKGSAAGNGTAATAGQAKLDGVKNYGQVTPMLLRGAQPNAEGWDALEKSGVQIVIDFRDEKSEIEHEQREVESRRMEFVSIPWSAFHDPAAEQVRKYFETLRDNPDKKIFVHCRKGADRTGTMVALYRIAAQGWTAEDAVREMKVYHLHAFWFGHLETYVEKFPEELKSDPALRGAAPNAPAPVAAPSTPQ